MSKIELLDQCVLGRSCVRTSESCHLQVHQSSEDAGVIGHISTKPHIHAHHTHSLTCTAGCVDGGDRLCEVAM